MTELDVAYSFNPNNHNNFQNFSDTQRNNSSDDNDINDDNDNDANNDSNNNYERLPEKKELPVRKERKEEQQPQQPQIVIPNNYNYSYNNYEEKQYKPQQQSIRKVQRNPEYSFWDRMVLSKNDVLKLIILSLIIVLGISIEKILFHYINQYLTENLLSPMQDFLVRLSIPVSVILFLWIIKSL